MANKYLCVSLGMAAMTVLSATVLAGDYSNAVTTTATASVNVAAACTITANTTSDHSAMVSPGQYTQPIGETTLTVICNDAEGFAIYAIGNANNEMGNNQLLATINGTLNNTYNIVTGTATSGDTSNWAMKVNAVSGTYTPTIQNSFDSFHTVPDDYEQVASYASATNTTVGAAVTSTYAAYIKSDQPAGDYDGKVKYTVVHPSDGDLPLRPYLAVSGCINYFPNANNVEGTMGCQSISTSATSKTLIASNFSRAGYGFAGWSDAYDYATNSNANFYGPNETISFTAGSYTGSNPGLSLYAVWVKSEGNLQDAGKSTTVCNRLTPATYDNGDDSDESTWSIMAGLSSVSALTDVRDNQTYAIARLTDGNCWMIENLRLDNTAQLTTLNTNNPLNDGTNVTLKHDYTDTQTYNTLSATSNSWCNTNSATCVDQSRLRTDNTASRATYTSNEQNMHAGVNLYSYGNYYNWYSATTGYGTYDFDTANNNTAGDLCPFGWHLPTGHSSSVSTTSGEFGLLGISLGGYQVGGVAKQMTSSTTPTGSIMGQRISHFPNNFIYSGEVDGASITDRGSRAGYLSPTVHSNTNPLALVFTTSVVNMGSSGPYKRDGESIRCMFDGAPHYIATSGGNISYNPNANGVEGTMGLQSISSSDTSATLLASNYSREGYGFAGWSDAYDYETNPDAHFYGPQEDIAFTAGQYDSEGLSLYAMWIPSAGSLQSDAVSVCNSLTAATVGLKSLASVSALTDQRDGQTYAIAKLADGKCWMIENLRLEAENSRGDNRFNSSVTNESLAQGYATSSIYGNFIGLADVEITVNDPYSANSMNSIYYTGTQSGTATINIGTDAANLRMPRYSNINTASRASFPTSNTFANDKNVGGMYSYGNYYTWSAVMANTILYSSLTATDANGYTSETVGTSICPTGWMLPYGGHPGLSEHSSYSGAPGSMYYLDTSLGGVATVGTSVMYGRYRTFPNNFILSGNDGSLRGSKGYFWTSSATSQLSPGGAYYFNLASNDVAVYGRATANNRMPIRCVKSSS